MEALKIFDKLSEADIKALPTTWKTYDGIPLSEDLQEIDLAKYTAYYGISVSGSGKLYLMDKGFNSDNLCVLSKKINEYPNFNPEQIITFHDNFIESKVLREIAENLKTNLNKKGSQDSIEFENHR